MAISRDRRTQGANTCDGSTRRISGAWFSCNVLCDTGRHEHGDRQHMVAGLHGAVAERRRRHGGNGSLLTTFVTDDFSGSGVCACATAD